MNSLADIEQSIRDRKLFRRGQKILVAVSGGVDSMVLLHLLHELSGKNKWRIAVAHFNHQLRGRSSDADERLVRQTAKRLGVPFVSDTADVRKFARAEKISIEMAARKLRHEFFARAARQRKIPSIALAHHADDQIELFFLRVLRGSGGEGLAGMKWKSNSPWNVWSPAFRRSGNRLKAGLQTLLVRPLLDMTKADLEKFAWEKGIRFREDASNASLDIQRNRIRHELLPLLRKKYQPALDRTILRLMDIVGAETEFVGQRAGEWLAKGGAGASRQPSSAARGNARPTKKDFANLPVAVQRRCIQLQLLEHAIPGDFDLIEKLRLNADRAVSISPQQNVARARSGRLVWSSAFRRLARGNRLKAELQTAGSVLFSGAKIKWKVAARRSPALPISNGIAGHEFFDADRVGARIILRHWELGDRFQPIGMSSPVKLQDLFTNLKIPRERRHELIVAVAGSGEIFWVEDLRMSERFKLTGETIRCLQWRWQRL